MKARLLTVALCAALASPALLEGQGTAVTLRAGTLGIAGGVTRSINDRFNVRLDVPYFAYSRTTTADLEDMELEYKADVNLFSVGGLVDFFPFRNALRLVAGAVYNDNSTSFRAAPTGPYTVGSVTYSPAQIGHLEGDIQMGSQIAPYVGIGVGNPVSGNKRIGFTMDMGALFSGAPKVTMRGSGMVEPTAENAPQLEENLDWISIYPVISLGLSVRLF
jgi:hypothetical protein